MRHFGSKKQVTHLTEARQSLKRTEFAVHFNIRSLRKHYDELCLFVTNCEYPPLAIVLSETWLSDVVDDTEHFAIDGYHKLINENREGRGGGVGLYLRNDLTIVKKLDLTSQAFECLLVECKAGSTSVGLVPTTDHLKLTFRLLWTSSICCWSSWETESGFLWVTAILIS